MIIESISITPEAVIRLAKPASFIPKPGCIVRINGGEGEGDYDVKAVEDNPDHWRLILTPRHTTPCVAAPNMAPHS